MLAYLLRDFGAVGHIPYLNPVKWEDDWPVLGVNGKVPDTLDLPARKGLMPGILAFNEFNRSKSAPVLPLVWQWNHHPDHSLYSLANRLGYLQLTSGRVDTSIFFVRNMVTQRTIVPVCSGIRQLTWMV